MSVTSRLKHFIHSMRPCRARLPFDNKKGCAFLMGRLQDDRASWVPGCLRGLEHHTVLCWCSNVSRTREPTGIPVNFCCSKPVLINVHSDALFLMMFSSLIHFKLYFVLFVTTLTSLSILAAWRIFDLSFIFVPFKTFVYF